jgi:uncharacterized protein HemX
LVHSIGGGALLAAALTLARVGFDYAVHLAERRSDAEERRRGQQRDADARLERILQDLLAEADRRLERVDAELVAERIRSTNLERELARTQQAYELLRARRRQEPSAEVNDGFRGNRR